MERARRLLFVCTGNICRSPMAAALADRVGIEQSIELEIRSASTMGLDGRPASPQMQAVAREIGIDLSTHRSQPLTEELVAWADTIAVMEAAHAAAITELDPPSATKVVPLGPLIGLAQIDDPYGRWFKGAYRRSRDELGRAVRRLLERRDGR